MQNYVELVGLGGVGKTTVAKDLVTSEYLNGYRIIHMQSYVFDRNIKFYFLLPFALVRSLPYIAHLIWFMFRYTRCTYETRRAFIISSRLRMRSEMYKFYNFDIVISENILHFLPGLAYRTNKAESAMKEIVRRYYQKCAGLVLFYTDEDTIKERFLARSRKSKKPKHRINHYLNTLPIRQQRLKQLANVINNETEVPILMVDGTKPVDEKVDEIVCFVQEQVLVN